MDTTDPEIVFDENGYCNHCTNAIKKLNEIYFIDPEIKKKRLDEIVEKIRTEGKDKKYDCIIGLSGGVDSSYLAYKVVELGLRPLAVHLDNGWDSELAVKNIENIVKKLNIDLVTHVIDWEEFRDLQTAYLKASVIDIEVLSDNAIVISINNLAKKFGIKYFLIGFNYATESIMPSSWLYSPKYDSLNIKSIYKIFGSGKKLKTYPLLSFYGYMQYRFFPKIKIYDPLNYLEYNKSAAIEILNTQFDWKDYGGKHYESFITKFYQLYILPAKFKVDKRRAHLSSLICSNQMTRQEAIDELKSELYSVSNLKVEKEYLIKKIGMTVDEFDEIINSKPTPHSNYASYNKMLSSISQFRKRIF
jgi:N-acetyl sugar amidotransferase